MIRRWVEQRALIGNRDVISRFNKTFAAAHQDFGRRLGQIVAGAAAAGTLRSGATIKQAYRELDAVFELAIDDCLALISKKTQHAGRKRKWLLDQLRIQVRHHGRALNGQISRNKAIGGMMSGDVGGAAERLFNQSLAKAVDRVDRYADGLTAPDDVNWPKRHPMLASLALAAVTAIAAEIWGLVDFIP